MSDDNPVSMLAAYEDGLQGYIDSARERGMFAESQKQSVYSEPNTAGSGKGQRALLWPYTQMLDKLSFTERQTCGDCFVPGTLVRMGDGTERAIESVVAGDLVASPFGGVRKVLSAFAKPYAGVVCRIRAEGCGDSVTATEDHRFVSYTSHSEWAWRQAGELEVGERVFLPAGSVSSGEFHTYDLADEEGCGTDTNPLAVGLKSKARRKSADDGWVRAVNGKTQCRRHVRLDEDVAWLIGIWLAEGSTDKSPAGVPHGLCWNLCQDELQIARRIRRVLATAFGIESVTYTLPSKPSCVFVRAGCAPLARWMYRICGSGNTYSKRVPAEVLSSPKSVKVWCLRGWLEGDGCVSNKPRWGKPHLTETKVSGVSVCRGLVRDMKYLAASSGLRSSEVLRRAYKQSKPSSELHFYSDSAVALFPGKLAPARLAKKESAVWSVDNGLAPRIKTVEHLAYTGDVFCIEVAEDHAFIANGYAVHNCTSHASRNARDTTRAVQILVDKRPEDFVVRGATEPTYGARGHGGEGMSPARAARFENETGFLLRKKYDAVDLSAYNCRIGTSWGSGGVPENIKALCRQNKVGIIRQITRIDDAIDALFNGYCLTSGQYASWSPTPNKQHIHPRTPGGWSHAMATVGMDFTRKFWPFDVFFIQNSWGPWNRAPEDWPEDYPPWVPGMIVTKAEDWEVCVRSEDCYAYGSVDGFPPQKLPDYGTVGLLRHD